MAGCDLSLNIPTDVVIRCATSDDCPEGFRCNAEFATCYTDARNQAPELLMDPVTRAIQKLTVNVKVLDANAAPFGDDRVTVYFEYTVQAPDDPASAWWPAVDENGATALVDLATLGREHNYPFAWDLVAQVATNASYGVDAGMDTAVGTAVVGSDAAGDGFAMIATLPQVTVRAQAVDAAGVRSEWTRSNTVMVGNDAPTVLLTAPSAEILRGWIPLQLELRDSAADTASVAVEFCAGAECAGDIWRTTFLAMGTTEALQTSIEGRLHVVVWDSAAVSIPDPLWDQGLGAVLASEVQVRARACDNPANISDTVMSGARELTGSGAETGTEPPTDIGNGYWGYCGEWVSVTLPTIDNRP